jgi:hypothetical protein
MKKVDLRLFAVLFVVLVAGFVLAPAVTAPHATYGSLFGLFASDATSATETSWPPADTKAGSEVRALMAAASILSTQPAFVNSTTWLLRNNTSAVCSQSSGQWICTLRAPTGETTVLYVDAAGNVSAGAISGQTARVA